MAALLFRSVLPQHAGTCAGYMFTNIAAHAIITVPATAHLFIFAVSEMWWP